MGRGQPTADDAVRDRIRGAGLRCTAARVAVLQHLETASGPLTHAEVSEALHHLGFDRATIYRNLTELTEAQLAARVELGDHVWRFEAKRAGGGHKGDDHPHFVCTTCGEVSCLDDVQVAITPRPAGGDRRSTAGKKSFGGGRIGSVTEILLKGRCEQCD
jgi:Fur family transcriptional regulator, ferric uptake regulator